MKDDDINAKMQHVHDEMYLTEIRKHTVIVHFKSDIEPGVGRLIIEGPDEQLEKLYNHVSKRYKNPYTKSEKKKKKKC